jgi:CRP/FNR family cyclic AMP-dependent transcriptional regulator
MQRADWGALEKLMSQSKDAAVERSLETIAVFAGLKPAALERIAARCNWSRYRPGEGIIDYLDTSDDVFFILRGTVRVSIYSRGGKAVTFSVLNAGEVFGEYAAIDRAPRSASIEATSACIVASMTGKAFRELLISEPEVTLALLRQAVKKVRGLTTRIYEFSALAVANRIQAEVLRLANLGDRRNNVSRIDPSPTHADIASRTSTHREAVTRELNRLTRVGLIERQARTLVVKDLARLQSLVREVTGE